MNTDKKITLLYSRINDLVDSINNDIKAEKNVFENLKVFDAALKEVSKEVNNLKKVLPASESLTILEHRLFRLIHKAKYRIKNFDVK